MDCFDYIYNDLNELDFYYNQEQYHDYNINQLLQQVIYEQNRCLQDLQQEIDGKAAKKQIRHWSAEEHRQFVQMLEYYHYRQAKYIADAMGGWTRNQIATHSQKFAEKVKTRVQQLRQIGQSVEQVKQQLESEFELGSKCVQMMMREFL